ncbi:MAG: ZirU family protein [Treponematales bacterium]
MRRALALGAAGALLLTGCEPGTFVIPAKGKAVVSLLDLTGAVTAPVKDAVPDTTAIDTDEYTGTVVWKYAGGAAFTGSVFAAGTVYKALVTLTAKDGFTFTGVAAFTHSGATSVSKTISASSAKVTITFKMTSTVGITGTARVGETLTADTSNLDGSGEISYQWKSAASPDGSYTDISGAAASTYTLGTEDAGRYIKVSVTREGDNESVESAAAGPVTIQISGSVTITGTARVGETLTADTTGLGGSGEISYQWKSAASPDGPYTDISGATASTYTPVVEDAGRYIKVSVTREGYDGSVESAAAGPVPIQVTITGTAAVGQTLTADTTGLGGSGAVSCQWKSAASPDGPYTDISGAAASTRTLVTGDAGKYIKVSVTREGDNESVESAAAGPVTIQAGGIIDMSDTNPVNTWEMAQGKSSGHGWVYNRGTKTYTISGGNYLVRGATGGGAASNGNRIVAATNFAPVVWLENAVIDLSTAGGCPLDLADGANVTLVLAGDNTLTASGAAAGVHVPAGRTLRITSAAGDGQESGTLTATGGGAGGAGAGIGGGMCEPGGTITITGGTVNAAGGSSGTTWGGAAAIGGGGDWDSVGLGGGRGDAGTITISGGKVTAVAYRNGAGIGGGGYALNTTGKITISGGVVTATGGGNGGAGIGGGRAGAGGTIRINSPSGTSHGSAEGKDGGKGVGPGNNGSGGSFNGGSFPSANPYTW